MRIVHLLNHSRKANGHVEVAVDLACEQARLGHDVFLVAGPGHFSKVLAQHGVTFVELRGGGMLRSVGALGELARVLKRVRPEIVHAHMVTSAVMARVVQLLCGYRLVTTLHNSFDRQSRLMGVGNLVIAVSDAVRREMEHKGIAARKLRVVHNGTVNGARRTTVPEQTVNLRRPAIVTVAGLHPRKGIDTLIEAFAEVRGQGTDGHLYIVGVGPQQEDLKRIADATTYGDAIHFMGYVADPRTVLSGGDIFVLASSAEPCALALIEARQMGCACIASNVGGNPEIMEFGNSGRLFTAGNTSELATLLRTVIEDKEELIRLRLAARSGWPYWTVERMARETIYVYEEAMGALHRPAKATVPERA